MVADFKQPGYFLFHVGQHSLVQFNDPDGKNTECTKLELIPFYDPIELPFAFAMTKQGLYLLDVKFRRQWLLKTGQFRDITTIQRDILDEPPARLIYSKYEKNVWSLHSLNLTPYFFKILRLCIQLFPKYGVDP